jgi:hypothetical protein
MAQKTLLVVQKTLTVDQVIFCLTNAMPPELISGITPSEMESLHRDYGNDIIMKVRGTESIEPDIPIRNMILRSIIKDLLEHFPTLNEIVYKEGKEVDIKLISAFRKKHKYKAFKLAYSI